MTPYQHISGEIDCYLNCVQNSPYAGVILLIAAFAVILFTSYLFISTPDHKVKIFAAGQLLIISSVWLSFSTMVCNSMLFIDIYIAYTLMTLGLMFIIPKVFDMLLVRKFNATPIVGLMDWTQKFVDGLVADAKVYYYDSAIPRAFASGRSIFLSVGLLELLDDGELRAVLAHESWHLMYNNKTHWMKQLSIMTFMPIIRSDIELMADRFAAHITGKDALDSARDKLS